jgi:hypothetical protein
MYACLIQEHTPSNLEHVSTGLQKQEDKHQL